MTIPDVLLYAAVTLAFLGLIIIIGAALAIAVHQFCKWRGRHG